MEVNCAHITAAKSPSLGPNRFPFTYRFFYFISYYLTFYLIAFLVLVKALLALTRHPSLSINQAAASLWIALFRHDRLGTDAQVLGCIGPWMEIARCKLIEPSAEQQEKDAFAQVDFDSDEASRR